MRQLNKIIESFDKHSSANAFCIDDRFFTYGELKDAVAHIQQIIKGAKPQSRIGILIGDDLETYASVLAVLFSGHAFVPISPLHPAERNRSIIEQAEIKILLSSNEGDQLQTSNLKQLQTSNLELQTSNLELQTSNFKLQTALSEENLAYVLFTSGSTGIPKGVPLTVKNLESFLDAFFSLGYEVDHRDRFVQMFDMTFDLSIMSYLAPLCIGACVYTIPAGAIKSMQVYRLMEQYDLTFALLVPSVITQLRSYFEEINLEKMRYCLFCGEALFEDITLEWAKCLPNAEIQNVYGPTEATIFCMTYDVNRNGKNKSHNGVLSIGKAMKNMESVIVDDNNNLLSGNEKGELCLAGAQVTPGYLSLVANAKNPFFTSNDTRYYRTGDLCYRDDDGDFYYIGRVDFQVKINGFRVELSEIEHHAREFLKTHAVVAHAQQNSAGLDQIFLFVENFKKDFDELNKYLKSKLPSYMIPAKVCDVDVFPLNSSGKVNRKELIKMIA